MDPQLCFFDLRAYHGTHIMNGSDSDTIAAVATAPGEAGIAIVRVSGPEALRIADALMVTRVRPSAAEPRRVLYGRIRRAPDPGAPPLDEVLLLPFRAPHSYTREDTIEIQAHGGRAVAAALLRAVCAAGARPAEPGEFTRRAFLNGRLDLLQAEAVADLIGAQTETAATAAFEQLSGRLSTLYQTAYDDIVTIVADLEATIDFVEDELPPSVPAELQRRTGMARDALRDLLATWHQGHLLREGALVAIVGEPNAGKSTLMNRLLGRERSIVTDIPGTTRDTIEETFVLDGILLRLVDTAGLRDADCRVEQEGIRRAQAMLQRADLALVIVDGSQPLTPAMHALLVGLHPAQTLCLLNKRDRGTQPWPDDLTGKFLTISTCLLEDSDVPKILTLLRDRIGIHPDTAWHAGISERHRQATVLALAATEEAHTLLDAQNHLDGPLLAAQALRTGLAELARITGREYNEDLLNSVFSRFCIGK